MGEERRRGEHSVFSNYPAWANKNELWFIQANKTGWVTVEPSNCICKGIKSSSFKQKIYAMSIDYEFLRSTNRINIFNWSLEQKK